MLRSDSMPIIYSNVSNGNYTVCCMGQTVYIYSNAGSELARFTLVMADFPVISPKGDIFAVKSKDGCLAVFSFEKLARTATLKFNDKETAYEKGMCFSADGGKLYSVEYNPEGSAVEAYDMNGGKNERFVFDKPISHIEYNGELYVLGKDENGFAAKIADGKLADIRYISDEDYEFYYNYKCAEARGFSSAAMEAFLPNLHNVEDNMTSISDLWAKYEEKTDE